MLGGRRLYSWIAWIAAVVVSAALAGRDTGGEPTTQRSGASRLPPGKRLRTFWRHATSCCGLLASSRTGRARRRSGAKSRQGSWGASCCASVAFERG
jgi:hypothetical protein